MNSQTTAKTFGYPLSTILAILTMFFFVFAAGMTLAQVPVDEDGNTIPAYYEDDLESADAGKVAQATDTILTSAELEELVGRVALYPDDLLAIVLPASAYPLEIVQAARFLEQLKSDGTLKPDEAWDESVVALLNYPEVVQMMDEDIDWTWRLGEAVISQQNDVLAAVEAFRDRAYAAGNLKTDENQTVTYEAGTIEIEPASEEIIYVPYYEPAEVVVYQTRPVYHYYPDPYPSYYYPYPVGYRFSSGYFWGVTTAFAIGWDSHYLHVYHPTYWGHPYYGHHYYGHYYRYPSVSVYNSYYVNNSYRRASSYYQHGDYWRPRVSAGARQDEPRVRNYHYPPGGDQRRRDDSIGRSRLDSRDNGRMALNLRERNDSDRIRVGASNNVRVGGATGSNATTQRGAGSDRGPVNSTERNTGDRNATTRISSGSDGRTGNRVSTNDQARTAGQDTQNRVRSNPRDTGTGQNQTRTTTPRPEIRFRDRGDDTAIAGSRNTVRAAGNGRTSASAASSNSRAAVERPEQRVSRTAAPRSTSPGISAPSQRTSAPRPSTPPSVRQSAPAPRASAPRASAPSVRQSAPAPRASAPSVRQSAPAPRASAPRVSAPSASGSSSGQRSGSQSRGSSSRPRNGNH